ncbi:hypothetical protein Tco_0991957 [Tanacetum coccineum]|uniref:Uncharacterized protein n=1 Tax=Tanacetum coccineum TaxID=301880 RepID=A0ABQ5F1H5_9ASTR
MDQDSAHMVAASKVPMLKPGEFELWRMRIEQYIQMINYALWEVIKNGNIAPKTTVMEGVEKVMPPTTTEEKAQKRLEASKLVSQWSDNQEKDEKQAKTTKWIGMEKTVKDKPNQSREKVNQDKKSTEKFQWSKSKSPKSTPGPKSKKYKDLGVEIANPIN